MTLLAVLNVFFLFVTFPNLILCEEKAHFLCCWVFFLNGTKLFLEKGYKPVLKGAFPALKSFH